jgi:hypothetical protein
MIEKNLYIIPEYLKIQFKSLIVENVTINLYPNQCLIEKSALDRSMTGKACNI